MGNVAASYLFRKGSAFHGSGTVRQSGKKRILSTLFGDYDE
jgi:hypothetical protein